MKTRLTHSNRRRSVPVRRINIIPLLALLSIGAIGTTLVLLFPMDWVRTPSVTISAERSAISPNGDGNLDTVPVIYSLSTDATVTVDVLDKTRSVVRVLVEAEPQAAGQHTVVWDGLNRLGQALPDGKYFVRVTAEATVQRSSANVQVDVDTQPPVIRLANLPGDTQVGIDGRELLIEGVTDPDAMVWLNDGVQPLTVNESGGFSVDYTLRDGVNRIELVAVDEAGNRASIVREITLLAQPPNIVVLNPPDGLWINQQMLSVQGTVPADVQVRVNRTEAQVDADGDFNVDVVLEDGENMIHIEATDAVGNASVEERRVYLRTRPPALSLTTVREGMTVREPSLLVVGQTEPHTTVWLSGRELAVDSQGGFQGLVDLIEGENVIRVEAVDRAGNTAVLVRDVTYAPAVATTTLPPLVRNVLAVAGVGVAGVMVLWLVSGLWQRPLSLVLRVTRPTLAPGTDGRVEPAVVVFDISRPATVTAEVWDAADRHVATVFFRQRRDRGEHLLVWDGRNMEGRVSPAGAYDIEVSASTLFNTVSGSTRVWIEESPTHSVWQQVWGHRGQARHEQAEW
jgi:flagellar hook assembly protein FlgD